MRAASHCRRVQLRPDSATICRTSAKWPLSRHISCATRSWYTTTGSRAERSRTAASTSVSHHGPPIAECSHSSASIVSDTGRVVRSHSSHGDGDEEETRDNALTAASEGEEEAGRGALNAGETDRVSSPVKAE